MEYIDDEITEFYKRFGSCDASDTTEETECGKLIQSDTPDDTYKEAHKHSISPSCLESGLKSSPNTIIIGTGDEGKPIEVEEDSSEETDLSEGVVTSAGMNDASGHGKLKKRPVGREFGTIMHRAFELAIIGLRDEGKFDPELCARRAILENNDNIEMTYRSRADDVKNEFLGSLLEIFPDFEACFRTELENAEEVLTEYPFNITIEETQIEELKDKLDIREAQENLFISKSGHTLCITGQADLVIKKRDGSVVIWDYKCNGRKPEEDDISFINRMKLTYSNQINLYKWIFEKKYGIKPEGKLYSVEIGTIEI